MLKPESELSSDYQKCIAILNGGWKGTYGELAKCLGRSNKSGRIIGRLVRSYTLRHPEWDVNNMITKATGKPAGHDFKNNRKT